MAQLGMPLTLVTLFSFFSNTFGHELCSEGELYENDCYLLVSSYVTFHEAQLDCNVSHNGSIVSIGDAHANNFIANLAGGGKVKAWIGATDEETEGVWKWPNGTALEFTNWDTGQPNSYRGRQNCVAINHEGIGKWDDVDCETRRPYICKTPMIIQKFVDGTCYSWSRLLFDYIDFYSATNTPDECIGTCASRGYSYAGVQDRTQCFCGNAEPPTSRIWHSSFEMQCTAKCPGDASINCGGTGLMNIYRTVKTGETTKTATATTITTTASSTAAGNVIFITGGDGTETSTEVLDPTGSCSRLTSPLPDRRRYHSMSRMGGDVVICGGGDAVFSCFSTICGSSGAPTSCISTRSPGGPWVHHSWLRSERSSHASVATEDTIHVFGGGYSGNTGDTLEEGARRFKKMPWKKHQLPEDIGSGSCAVAIHKMVYITGGSKGWTSTWKWNTESEQWTQLADMEPHGRQNHGCGVITVEGKSMILVAGGWGGSKLIPYKVLRTSAIYNIEENNWSSIGELNQARNDGVMVNVGEDVYMLGGTDAGYNVLNTVEKFNVATKEWVTTNFPMKERRNNFAAVSVNRDDFC